MYLEKGFNKLGSVWKNRILTAIIALCFTYGYNKWDLYVMKKELIETRAHSEEYRREAIAMDIKYIEAQNKNMQLQIELVQCRAEYMDFRSSLDDIPYPAWRRDVETEYITYVNDAFVEQSLKPLQKNRFDLLYKPSENIYGKMDAEHLKSFYWVVKHKRVKETVDRQIAGSGFIYWRSTKYPIFEDGKIKAVGGLTIPTTKQDYDNYIKSN